MEEIRLFTRDGQDVGVTITMPKWMPGLEPDAILWGSRTFFRNSGGRYVEGFLYAACDAKLDTPKNHYVRIDDPKGVQPPKLSDYS